MLQPICDDIPVYLEAITRASNQSHSSCWEDYALSQNMVCLPPHVFAFCIIMAALVSGIVVSSQRIYKTILQKFRKLLEPSRAHSPNPHLRHPSASHQSDIKDSEGLLVVEAAEAMDRATAVPLQLDHKVPARYVRAFCGNEKHALERWKATLKWREENKIDSILNEPQPFFHDIRRYFPSHLSGRSRGGHIVVYEKLGGVDMRTLGRLGVTVPVLLRHWTFVSEYMYRVLQPTDSAQQITIEDMKGVRMQPLAGKIQEYVKATARLARLHYVERCHKTFVVNAPAWFGLSFRVVSPFLSARTRQKIRILDSDLSVLHDEIDPQFLPVEYGGTMAVPVSESTEERNLRGLVDAINAKAKNGNADTTITTTSQNGSRSSRNGKKPAPVQRSASQKARPAASPHDQRQQPNLSPKNGRSRDRTRRAVSLPPERNLGPREATWAGNGGLHSPEMSQNEVKGEKGPVSLPDSPAAVRPARVGVSAELGVAGWQDLEGRRASMSASRAVLGDKHKHRSQDDQDAALSVEDRLQAVMKDLGVPLGEQDRVVPGGSTRSEVDNARETGQRAKTRLPSSDVWVGGSVSVRGRDEEIGDFSSVGNCDRRMEVG